MSSFRKYSALIAISAFLLFSAGARNLISQEFRSNLTGQVTDPSGAVVPNATVTAVMNDTHQTYTAKTTGAGVYYIPYVLPGTYTMTVKAQGFKTNVQDNVLILAAQSRGVNFKLEVGSLAQAITVTSVPPLIDTASGSGGSVLQARAVENLPLNGRQVYMLTRTTPGSQFTQTQFGASGYSGTRGWDVSNAYSIGGSSAQAGNFNNFTLNGTNITVMTGFGEEGTWMTAPNVDALQEVNIQDQMFDARYGRTGGGVVNMVTKAGTNAYHGEAYDYLENGSLNANVFENNYNGLPVQKTIQNQFGGTFGGPIIKNKVFFFGSFEGYRETIPFQVVTSVPTAAERTGDFSATQYTIYDPTTTVCNSPGGTITNCPKNNYGRTEFAGDKIPAGDISKMGAAMVNLFPMPNINLTSDRNNYASSAPDKYRYDQPMARLDFNTSDKTRWYTTFEWQGGNEFRDSSGFTGAAENGNINHDRNNMVATQDMTHVFSPSLVGDFKLSFARFGEFEENGDFAAQQGISSLGLNYPFAGTAGSKNLLPQVTFGEIYPQLVGNQLTDNIYTNTVFDADFTKNHGRHTIEFGGEVGEYNFASAPGGSPNGDFSFGTGVTQYNPTQRDTLTGINDGNVIAGLLLGYPTGGGVDWNSSVMEGTPMWDIYAQDNIRINHRLTMNIGLRYDVQRGLRERYNRLNRGVCTTCVNPITNNPTYQANLAADTPALLKYGFSPASIADLSTLYGGILFPGVGGQSVDAYNTDWSNIGPRIGFAYALNSKTVVRGGWGWMYSYGIEGGTRDGFSITTSYIPSLNGATPTNYFLTGNPFPNGLDVPVGSSLGLLTGVGNTASLDFPGRRIPRIQIMSIGVQRELPGHMLLDVKYAGNYTRNLRDFQWTNGVLPLSGGPMPGSICGLSGNVGYPQLQQNTYNSCVGNWYNSNVPNPFYGVLPINSSEGSSPTIQATHLLVPYPEFGLVGDNLMPLGRVWYDSLQVKLDKRLYGETRGLSFQVAYTYSKDMQSDSYRNGWPWQDANQIYEVTGDDRTHIFTFSSVWDLPMGRGAKYILSNPSPVLNQVVSGWRLSSILTVQSGTPDGIAGRYPVAGSTYIPPAGGSATAGYSYIPPGGSTFGQWINNCGGVPLNCLPSTPAFSQGNQPDRISYVRNPTVPDLDLSLIKDFPITETKRLEFRADAFNFTNTPLFPGPDTNPNDGAPKRQANGNWQGFGTINLFQQNFPRIVQLSLKFLF
ncbi:MAG TPA: carboxypeptidase-like regulatory domain-containing protein [Terriglobia bacterium]|nr:carboxypeptidase-like regulatory domain-containing protein [Terriglobia bacterium]